MAAAEAAAVEEIEEPSGDELDNLKFREVSMSRFKRNHEYLSEIFSAYSISTIIAPESPYQTLSIEELEKRLVDGEAEIEKMKKEDAEKMKRFNIESNILSRGIQEIKKCTSLGELAKIQDRTEKELGIVIEPYNPVTVVQIRDTSDSEVEEDDEQREMMQDEGIDEGIDGELDMEDQLLDAVDEEELVGIGQGLSTYDIDESLVTGNEIDSTSGIVEGYLNPVDVVSLNGDQNFVSNPSFTNDAILSNDPTTYIGDPSLNVVNTTAYAEDSSEITYDYMSAEDEAMIN